MSGHDFVNKKVLVTGATGFIGSHIAQRMVKKTPGYLCWPEKPLIYGGLRT
jgi:nucleoside-diphosphate-sugar epimerase